MLAGIRLLASRVALLPGAHVRQDSGDERRTHISTSRARKATTAMMRSGRQVAGRGIERPAHRRPGIAGDLLGAADDEGSEGNDDERRSGGWPAGPRSNSAVASRLLSIGGKR